jgi:hypothetical protein
LISNNHAVTQFLCQPNLNLRQARWVQTLFEYSFDLYHIPSKDNSAADALSRRPDHAAPSMTADQIHAECVHALDVVYNHLNIIRVRPVLLTPT